MTTPQASALGFPNSLIGIGAFAVVTVTGVLAVAKVPLPRWYWVGMTLGTLAGAGFVHWLIFQSLYRIGALCPYCMVVWVVTISLLVVVTSIAFGPNGQTRGGVVTRELLPLALVDRDDLVHRCFSADCGPASGPTGQR